MKKIHQTLTALVVAIALDSLTKTWVERLLIPFEPVPLAGRLFRLTLGYNTGVAFGLFANGGVWPLIATGLIIVGMVTWLLNAMRTDDFPHMAAWPLGLILGGAIANFIDRLPDGRVTDFLDIGFGATRWPTFNLADTFIVTGVVLILWLSSTVKQPLEGNK